MLPNDIIVLTPPGLRDPSITIAAARAGARGFLDLENVVDHDAALAAIAKTARFVPDKFGIRLGRNERSLVKHLLETPPAQLGWVLLTDYDGRDLKAVTNAFADKGI